MPPVDAWSGPADKRWRPCLHRRDTVVCSCRHGVPPPCDRADPKRHWKRGCRRVFLQTVRTCKPALAVVRMGAESSAPCRDAPDGWNERHLCPPGLFPDAGRISGGADFGGSDLCRPVAPVRAAGDCSRAGGRFCAPVREGRHVKADPDQRSDPVCLRFPTSVTGSIAKPL